MKLVSNSQTTSLDADEKSSQLSALVDGELTPDEIGEQTSSLCSDGREREQWQSYHLIRDLLQQQMPQEHNSSFTRQVMVKLENEPTVLAPAKKTKTWTQKVVAVGLAASVASVALLSSYVLNDPDDGEQIQMVADAQSTKQKPAITKDVEQWKRDPDLEQFSPYLANHAAFSSGSVNQGFMPYARVVGYSNEK